ncbi:MAG: 6-bladed beta-propeller [Candidatus Aminicenantes bacterium]
MNNILKLALIGVVGLGLAGILLIRKGGEVPGDGPVLIHEEERVLWKKEDGENHLFARIRFDVDDEENLYVLDERLRNIRVFDKSGYFVRHIGRIGQGPGEFQNPCFFIQVTPEQELVVYDQAPRKLIYYSLHGRYIKEKSVLFLGIPFKTRIDSKGDLVCFFSGSPPSEELKKFDSHGEVLGEFHSRELKIDIYSNDLKVAQPTVCFALTQDDHIVWGYSQNYEIEVIDPDGRLVRRIEKKRKPLKFTEKDKRKYRTMYEGMIAQGAELVFPSFHPFFGDISVDEKNRVFVRTYEKNEKGAVYYDVFSLTGEYLAKVPLPHAPRLWKNNKAYAVTGDEDGYPMIIRYAVEWR